jgi:hypothetical protein
MHPLDLAELLGDAFGPSGATTGTLREAAIARCAPDVIVQGLASAPDRKYRDMADAWPLFERLTAPHRTGWTAQTPVDDHPA